MRNLWLMVCMVLAGCATTIPNEILWASTSAERWAIFHEVYAQATTSARSLSAGLQPGSWGVILDVDDTILDTSVYNMDLAKKGKRYTMPTWNAWILEGNAPLLPGAREFIDVVIDELHGHVVLVTNREQSQCPVTEQNLHAVGVRYDRILCKATQDSNKNPRFQSVINGTPPLNVIMWVGDNIQDFPELSQQQIGDPKNFGTRYFALPNPTYGSWQ
ncbi:MAG TPA: HAD family acid phosphatase [Povalibacter sp.]|nr:HAD family acid phosphatase [Povalibacter sp.]